MVVYIPEIDRYIEVDANYIAGQAISGFNLEGHEWLSIFLSMRICHYNKSIV